MNIPSSVKGGCYCGGVRVELRFGDALPGVFHCHCSMCRRLHGAPFVAWVAVEEAALEVDLDLPLERFASSERVVRERCPSCGTPMFLRPLDSGRVLVARSCFGDDPRLAPRWHVHWEDRCTWAVVGDELPRRRPAPSADPASDGLKELAAAAHVFEGAAFADRGNAAMNAGKNTEALNHYDRAEELGYKKFSLYANRGFLRMQEGRYAASLQDLQKALELEPDDLRQRAIAAQVLCNLDRRDDARLMVEGVLGREPQEPRTLVWVARALSTLDDPRALPILEALRATRAGLTLADQRNVLSLIADIALADGRTQDAIQAYAATEAAGASHWSLFYNRARARLDADDLAGAEADVRRALRARTDLAQLRALLAHVLARQGLVDDARAELQIVLQAKTDGWASWHAARALDLLGEHARSSEVLDGLRARAGLPKSLLRRLADS